MRVLQLGWSVAVRYCNEMYVNTKNARKGVSVDYRLITPWPILGSMINFPTETYLIDLHDYDLVHNLGGAAFFPQRKGDTAVVTSANEMQPILYPEITPLITESFEGKAWELFTVRPAIRALLNSDYVIANSQQTRDGAIKAGYSRKRISVVPHGLDPRFFRPMPKRKGHKGFKVGTISTMSIHKNTPFTIKTFRNVSDKNIRFEIWGRNLYSQAETNSMVGGDQRIHIMGRVPEDKMVDVYDSFDVFMFPSLYEGFGIPLIEAKARGLPIIIWKNSHISEEVKRYCIEARDEEHAAEIIEKIKANGPDERLRKKQIESTKELTWQNVGKWTLECYDKALALK